MKVIMCRVGQEPTYEVIGDELEAMQKAVHGYIEELPLDDDFSIVCNEEGKLNGMRPNRMVADMSDMTMPPMEVIFGDFFICRTDAEDEDYVSVKDGDLMTVIDRFGLEMFHVKQ